MLGSALLGSFYLASATAQTPGLPPPIPVGRKAVLYARGNIARGNATRGNYIRPNITVLMTKYRYPDPPTQVDVTPWTRTGTLNVHQALNDEPDTCSLTFKPELLSEHIPQVGDEIAVGLATEGTTPLVSAYATRILADGPIAYWRLNDTEGNTTDELGGAHGVVSGGVTRGQPGALADGDKAMVFDGSTGKIELTSIVVPIAFSVEGWVKFTNTPGGHAAFWSNRIFGNLYTGTISGHIFLFMSAPEGPHFEGTRIINDDHWHHVVFTNDGAKTRGYVDGTLDKEQNQTHLADTSPCTIGCDVSTNMFWQGAIDDVALYARALTPQQVAEHHTLRTAGHIRPPDAKVRIAGGLEFHGSIVTKQHDRRPKNETPWIAVNCQDWSWFFDAQLVNAAWPTQSATLTILDLVARFVNYSQLVSNPPQFTTDYVAKDLPTCEAFVAVNWRATDVLRHLTAAVKGGFYIDARRGLHVWANGPEAQQTPPRPLSDYLSTLKTFRHTIDATQIRKRTVVEGMRTTTLVDVPALPQASYTGGVPVADARPFALGAPGTARLGSQWVQQQVLHTLQPSVENPFTAHVTTDFALSDTVLRVDAFPPFLPLGTNTGWVKVGEQFIRYSQVDQQSSTLYLLSVNSSTFPFGRPIAPIKVGETVAWIDWVDAWIGDSHTAGSLTGGGWLFEPLRATRSGTELVVMAQDFDPDADQPWTPNLPPIEALVVDGRYSYAGAQARAVQETVFFRHPRLSAEWDTFDYNARPGRSQIIQLTETDPVNAVLTILSVDLAFELKHLAPRRRCTAALVKPATLLDVLMTTRD